MKKVFYIVSFLILLTSCEQKEYAQFGDVITNEDVLSTTEMESKFKEINEKDTLDVKFESTIVNVCQKKGCWMTLNLGEEEVFVKFKDYGFFVPKNTQEKEVIVKGKAFKSVISVDELKHYAKDEGKTQEAIDSIIAPKVTYSFMADGVLIAKQ